jgi:hypothetical protein
VSKNDVFLKRPDIHPGLTLAMAAGLNPKAIQKGEVGIEIEVEGKRLPGLTGVQTIPPPWKYKPDHSLRGEETGEYVLTAPVNFSEVPGALESLWNAFEQSKTKFDTSNRTSVHVHLNAQRWHINRIASFAALHFALEEPLTNWCGEHRVGNLFCQRAKDSEAIITWLKKFIQHDGEYELPDGLHYAGFNAHALTKFGSIEIRTLRGVSNPNVIQDWVGIYERLYKFSGEYKDPSEVIGLFSMDGPSNFFDMVLGDYASVVRADCGMTQEEIADSLYASIRRAQDIAYCRDWSEFRAIDVGSNPFGMTKKRLMKKAMAAAGLPEVFVEDSPAMLEPQYDEEPDDLPPLTASQVWASYTNSTPVPPAPEDFSW